MTESNNKTIVINIDSIHINNITIDKNFNIREIVNTVSNRGFIADSRSSNEPSKKWIKNFHRGNSF